MNKYLIDKYFSPLWSNFKLPFRTISSIISYFNKHAKRNQSSSSVWSIQRIKSNNNPRTSWVTCVNAFKHKSFLFQTDQIKLISPRNYLHTSQNVYFHLSKAQYKKTVFENPYSEELEKKRRKNYSPNILVMDLNGEVKKMSLDAANKYATHHDLKLVKVEDPSNVSRSGKQLYQLMTGKQYFKDVLMVKDKEKDDSATTPKGEKIFTLKAHIDPHDLSIKIKKILHLLEKRFEVKVLIQSSTKEEHSEKPNQILSEIQEAISQKAKVAEQQNTSKGIKLLLQPIVTEKEEVKES